MIVESDIPPDIQRPRKRRRRSRFVNDEAGVDTGKAENDEDDEDDEDDEKEEDEQDD